MAPRRDAATGLAVLSLAETIAVVALLVLNPIDWNVSGYSLEHSLVFVCSLVAVRFLLILATLSCRLSPGIIVLTTFASTAFMIVKAASMARTEPTVIVCLAAASLEFLLSVALRRRLKEEQAKQQAVADTDTTKAEHLLGSADGDGEGGEGKPGDEGEEGYKSSTRKGKSHANFGRLFQQARPEKLLLSLGVLNLMLSTGAQMYSPQLFGELIDYANNGTSEQLNLTALKLGLVFLVASVFTFFRACLFTVAGERVVARLRKDLFYAITVQEVAFFDRNLTGDLLSRITADTTEIKNAVTVNISMGLRFAAQVRAAPLANPPHSALQTHALQTLALQTCR